MTGTCRAGERAVRTGEGMDSNERAAEEERGRAPDLSGAIHDLGVEARALAARFGRAVELERRMGETPGAVLGIAAAAGFVLGGGLWPLLRPFVKAAVRSAFSPGNVLAWGAALGTLRAARWLEPDQPGPSQLPH